MPLTADVDAALAILQLAESLISDAQTRPGPYRIAASLIELAATIESTPMLLECMNELATGELSALATLTGICNHLSRESNQALRVIANALRSGINDAHLILQEIQGNPERNQTLLDLFTQISLSESDITIDPRHIHFLGLHIMPQVESRFKGHLSHDAQQAIRRMKELSTRAQAETIVLGDLLSQKSVALAISQLRALHRVWTAICGATEFSRQFSISELMSCDVDAMRALVARMKHHLTQRKPVVHALNRLRTYLEHFAYEELRKQLRHEEESITRKQNESIIQHFMDAFLFKEDFFPITQCETSRGRLDTLLVAARTTREIPILIELKQAVSISDEKSITAARIASTIVNARPEITRYLEHVRSKLDWAHVDPYIVVVHTCTKDLTNHRADDVVFINISSKSPSE
jgi:hypothetical protein